MQGAPAPSPAPPHAARASSPESAGPSSAAANWLPPSSVEDVPGKDGSLRKVVPLEEARRALEMADAALKAKQRAAERKIVQAASLGYQKGLAASSSANMLSQVQRDMEGLRQELASAKAEKRALEERSETASVATGASGFSSVSAGALIWQMSERASRRADELGQREKKVALQQLRTARRKVDRQTQALRLADWQRYARRKVRAARLLARVRARLAKLAMVQAFEAWLKLARREGNRRKGGWMKERADMMDELDELRQALRKAQSQAERWASLRWRRASGTTSPSCSARWTW